MDRQYVHLSETKDMAVLVGKRRDNDPVILVIDSKKAYEDGIKFYKELNGVWLSDFIDSKYLKK